MKLLNLLVIIQGEFSNMFNQISHTIIKAVNNWRAEVKILLRFQD